MQLDQLANTEMGTDDTADDSQLGLDDLAYFSEVRGEGS